MKCKICDLDFVFRFLSLALVTITKLLWLGFDYYKKCKLGFLSFALGTVTEASLCYLVLALITIRKISYVT